VSGRAGEVRLVLTLAVAGLLSGLAIVGAYRLTLPAVQRHQAAALRRAVLEVLPGAERMEAWVWRGGVLVEVPAAAKGEAVVYAGLGADGGLVGYAIPAEGAGFQDTIRLLYGFDPSRRRVVGMAVLESRETPGLGDRIYKDERFVAEFADLAVDPEIELVKGEGSAPQQVDAITGATISSRAVVRILNVANREWLPRLSPASAAAAAAPAAGARP
jgi:electron transport complex protein RnfG